MPSKPSRSRRPAIAVRPATLADLDVLVRFSAAMARETEGRTLTLGRLRKGIRSVLESGKHGRYLVAESGASVVGQLLLTYEWSDWRNGVFWWIQSVYVAPSARRRGVYQTLHKHVVRDARERGDVCGVRLYVEQDNRAAQAAYAGLGLTVTAYRIYEQDFVL
ncbi:MAG: N-acetyltransferase [Nitrospirales bacterium]|nr:N-acetyltransferase [Nitrospirales bacterium]